MIPKLLGLAGNKGVGKSTYAERLIAQVDLGIISSFAEPIRDMLETLIGKRHLRDKKEETVPWLGVTGRRCLQTLGTEWGRDIIDKDIWVKVAEREIFLLGHEVTIIFDDLRFENEAEMIKRRGGEVWRLTREGVSNDISHCSEHGIPDELVDKEITL